MRVPLFQISRSKGGQIMLVVPALVRVLAQAGPGEVTGLSWSVEGNLVLQGLVGSAEIRLTVCQRLELLRLAKGEPVTVAIVDYPCLRSVQVTLGVG